MMEEFLAKTIVYTAEAMQKGSMWWWIPPLAPGVPERLIVGHERAFLTWFYEGASADLGAISEALIQEMRGDMALGDKVAETVKAIGESVTGRTLSACGHFIPEEKPEELMRVFHQFVAGVS